jgi:hypothetical protein
MGYRDVTGPKDVCPGCKAEVERGTRLCPACGAPVDIARFAEMELALKPALRKSRLFLAVVAGLGLFELLVRRRYDGRGPSLVELLDPMFFVGCTLAAGRWPLGASIAAMSAFLMAQAYALGAWSLVLFEGILFKAVFVVLLSASIRAGYRTRDLHGQWSKRVRNVGVATLVGSAAAGFILGLLRHL